jgi:hypothetical protein
MAIGRAIRLVEELAFHVHGAIDKRTIAKACASTSPREKDDCRGGSRR